MSEKTTKFARWGDSDQFKINLEDRKIYWAPSVKDWEGVTYDNI